LQADQAAFCVHRAHFKSGQNIQKRGEMGLFATVPAGCIQSCTSAKDKKAYNSVTFK
jgi:hypothetical protein